ENNKFKIIYLQDYTHMLMRTAIMPNSSENLEEAKNFLRFLLSDVGQNFIEHSTDMLSLKSEFLPSNRHFRPIRLDTGLLVYLDKLKKERFLEDWREAIIQ
ncbi:MAG: ABC transporter substrate-binding protein, partial [Candidatus Puniceispirillaceae bacterium]